MPGFDPNHELAIICADDRNEPNVVSKQMPGLLISMHDSDLSGRMLGVTSLYHIGLEHKEPTLETLLNAGLHVKQVLEENPALCGVFSNNRFVAGPAYDPSDAALQYAMAKCNWIARTVLDKPGVASYIPP